MRAKRTIKSYTTGIGRTRQWKKTKQEVSFPPSPALLRDRIHPGLHSALVAVGLGTLQKPPTYHRNDDDQVLPETLLENGQACIDAK
jgi:hypothetical protein